MSLNRLNHQILAINPQFWIRHRRCSVFRRLTTRDTAERAGQYVGQKLLSDSALKSPGRRAWPPRDVWAAEHGHLLAPLHAAYQGASGGEMAQEHPGGRADSAGD